MVKPEIEFGLRFMVPDLVYKFHSNDLLKGNLSYRMESKCGTHIQTWVKLNSPAGNTTAATTRKGTYSCHCGRHKLMIYL